MEHSGDLLGLRCRCGGALRRTAPGVVCGVCASRYPVDGLGVVRLSEADEPWDGVPAHASAAARRSATVERLVDEMVDGDEPWPADLRRRLLHPAGGAAATLVPLGPGATALDLGTGWSTLARAVRSFGAAVASADWVYPRLRFDALMHDAPADVAVHINAAGPLPWPDGSFDVVFVDLSALERALRSKPGAAQAQDRMLAEVRRVLADDGALVAGTRNPLRDLARRGLPAARGADFWQAVRRPSGEDRLRRAGFTPARVVVPYPGRETWRWLIPQERLRAHLRATMAPSSPRRRAVRLAVAAGAGAWVMADYYVVARTGRSSLGPVRTLAEQLAGGPGEPAPVTMALSDARVAIAGARDFVKLPLSREQQDKIVDEVRKTNEARETAFAPFVIDRARVERWGALPYGVYPLLTRPRSDPARARATVDAALRAVDAGVTAPVGATTFWRRLSGPQGGSDADDVGAGALRERVLGGWGPATVPVGPTHGDLHAGNTLLPGAGHPLLVDWNRFERLNPLLLDGVYAAVDGHRTRSRATLAQALVAFADGEIRGRIADRAATVLGELTPLEAATLVLLDRAMSYGLPRRRHRPWTLPPLEQAVAALAARLDDEDRAERG
ncbi:methyltransferase domain-containing protein [Georgenia sp. SYP-B2076]|uniref:methyltransferase domain-containing protein n=1 Tax=Georgenia sp. SYP-B2076 TaxID=2495881 RepID=UPI000F8DBC34|nr:methyltransferase domain-containing protein [Georgenia sp. SYP-B2076]